MNILFLLWIAIFIFCFLLELTSPGLFFFLSIAIGAVITSLINLLNFETDIQLIVFVLATLLSFLILKNWVKKSVKGPKYKTNVYALIGKKGFVTQVVGNDKKGWVTINGELWSAYTKEVKPLTEGTQIEVIGQSGSHIIVKKAENN